MNFDFSVNELLERLVPGFILVIFTYILLDAKEALVWLPESEFLIGAIVFSLSYGLGVALNILGGFIPFSKFRTYWDHGRRPDNAVSDAISSFFNIEADDDSWKYCYGICQKTGYSVNVELFRRLEIFCRTTFAAFLILSVAYAAHLILFGFNVFLFCMLLANIVSAFLFLFGARIYSQAFVGAIYQGFYTWYVVHKNQLQNSD